MKRTLKNVIESHKNNLHGADLQCVNLSKADLYGADLRSANLKGAIVMIVLKKY